MFLFFVCVCALDNDSEDGVMFTREGIALRFEYEDFFNVVDKSTERRLLNRFVKVVNGKSRKY